MNRNVRQGKLLTKLQEMSFFKKNILFIAICFVLLAFSTIGYSALNQKLFISGDLALRAVKDIRISDLKLVETLSGGYEQYNSKYTADTITITSALAEDGSATTYQATITNYGTTDMEIASISSNSTTWFADCTIIGLAKGDEISAGTSKTFKITLKRKANIATTDYVAATLVEFKFQEAKIRYLAYNIGGNSIQNGTPSPDNPVEIQSVGDKTNNLFDPTAWSTGITENGITIQYLEDEDCFLLNGKATETVRMAYKRLNIPTEIGKKYVISTQRVSGSIDKSAAIGAGYAVAYIGKSDDTTTNENWLDTRMPNDNITSFKVGTSDNKYISAFWFYASSGVQFNDYKVKIQIEQNDTATEYEPYGYKIPIKVSGKNLFNPNSQKEIDAYSTIKFGETDKTYSVSITDKDVTVDISGCYLAISDGATYVGHNTNFSYLIANGAITNKKLTTLTAKSQYYLALYPNTQETWDKINERFNIMINEGNNFVDYEPYVEPITNNIYLDEPLRKIGDYADYIDFKNQKVVRYVKETSLERKQSKVVYYYKNKNRYGVTFQQLLDTNYDRTVGLCNRDSQIGKIFQDTGNYMWFGVANNSVYWIGILETLGIYSGDKTNAEMIEAFNTWLDNNPTYIYHPLQTPTSQSVSLPEIIKKPYYTKYEVMSDVAPSAFTYDFVEK